MSASSMTRVIKPREVTLTQYCELNCRPYLNFTSFFKKYFFYSRFYLGCHIIFTCYFSLVFCSLLTVFLCQMSLSLYLSDLFSWLDWGYTVYARIPQKWWFIILTLTTCLRWYPLDLYTVKLLLFPLWLINILGEILRTMKICFSQTFAY